QPRRRRAGPGSLRTWCRRCRHLRALSCGAPSSTQQIAQVREAGAASGGFERVEIARQLVDLFEALAALGLGLGRQFAGILAQASEQLAALLLAQPQGALLGVEPEAILLGARQRQCQQPLDMLAQLFR